jgi:large subunit ribosomal protein L10
MPKTKERKKEIVEELRDLIRKQKVMAFVGIHGLKTPEIFDLRNKLKEKEAILKVAKKTLMEIAFKEEGIKFDKDQFKEQTAVVFGMKDEIAPLKVLYQQKEIFQNLKILGGFLENKFLDAEKIITLAQLPSKEELLSKFLYALSYPIQGFINICSGNLKGLLFALKAMIK